MGGRAGSGSGEGLCLASNGRLANGGRTNSFITLFDHVILSCADNRRTLHLALACVHDT